MRANDAAVILNVGDRRFTLVAGQVDAWAPDMRADAAIAAAMRSATSMGVQTPDARWRGFADRCALRGAATAGGAAAWGRTAGRRAGEEGVRDGRTRVAGRR